MDFIFSTGSLYSYGLARSFELAARAGFDGIELLVDARWDTRQPEYLRALVERYAIPILAVHSPFLYVPGWSIEPPEQVAQSVALAETLGARAVVHHLPRRLDLVSLRAGGRRYMLPAPESVQERRYREWLLSGYPALQARTPVRLCIENMPAGRYFGRRLNIHHWNTVEAITRFPTLTMDTTHLGTWGLEPLEVYQRWGGQVAHVHLSNFDGREHRRPEDGRLHLDRLLRALAADRYDGLICLELEPHSLEAGAPDERVAALLTESLRLCREWAASA